MAPLVLEFLGGQPRRSPLGFCDRSGRRLNGNTVSRRLKRAVRAAGLDPALHFHFLRHTGITLLLTRGVPAQYVQRIAGHSSLAVTSGYAHVQNTHLVDAVSSFRALLPGPVSNSVSSN